MAFVTLSSTGVASDDSPATTSTTALLFFNASDSLVRTSMTFSGTDYLYAIPAGGTAVTIIPAVAGTHEVDYVTTHRTVAAVGEQVFIATTTVPSGWNAGDGWRRHLVE